MKLSKKYLVEVDENGCLRIPPELAASFGLKPGAKVLLQQEPQEVRFARPVESLARVYIEPTNRCNLDCVTCMRNVWDEPLGYMSAEVFECILQGIRELSPRPLVFFGGFGEPLVHPQLLEMIRAVKGLGCPVEMITNGIFLTDAMAHQLIQMGLDGLWVSIDGATPDSYSDVRLGAALPNVLQNLMHLRVLRDREYKKRPQIGVAFVAMRRNIRDLPAVLRLSSTHGVERFSISNVLAHTEELRQEILYRRTIDYSASISLAPLVSFPRMDVSSETLPAFGEALNGQFMLQLFGAQTGPVLNTCPFVQKGSTSIRWDGALSPCLPLLHTHDSYLDERLRRSKAFSFGNILERSLSELWNDPAYYDLRQRLRDFDFSPCTFCNSCDMADSNQEDCWGNLAPTCGGCLWAQGMIQCP